MRFTTIFATAALALGVAAEPQDDPLPYNVIDSRIWSSPDCGNNENIGNLGELTTHRDENGECFKFNDPVKSVSQTGHATGCKLLLYKDDHCRHGEKSPRDFHCLKAPTFFNSWKTVCKDA